MSSRISHATLKCFDNQVNQSAMVASQTKTSKVWEHSTLNSEKRLSVTQFAKLTLAGMGADPICSRIWAAHRLSGLKGLILVTHIC